MPQRVVRYENVLMTFSIKATSQPVDRRKEDAITGGDPGILVTIFREVSRGHSSYGNEPAKIAGGLTKVMKD